MSAPETATKPSTRTGSALPWRVVVLAIVAGAPSLAWGLFGGGFLTDDWSVWMVLEQLGVRDGLHRLAFEQPARPLAAPYYGFAYLVVGDRPVVHGLLMAAANAALILAAWAVGRRFLRAELLWPALTVLALAPNHASTRFWFVVVTYPLALACVLASVVLLDRRRTVAAAALSVGAVLLYEGPVALGATLVVAWALRDLRLRLRPAAIVLVPTAVVAAVSLLLSPKRGDAGPGPFDNAESFLPGQMGVGLWELPGVAVVAGMFVLLGLTLAVASFLPSFRGALPHAQVVLAGAGLALVSAAPFLVSGSIFGTTGVFDRNNLIPGVGVALLLGSLWAAVRSWSRTIAWGAAVAVGMWFVVLQIDDLGNWIDAVEHGEALVESMAAVQLRPGEDLIVVPEQPHAGTGVADFIYDGDLQAALRYRHEGEWSGVRLIENVDCGDLLSPAGTTSVFDWAAGEVRSLSAAELSEICVASRS